MLIMSAVYCFSVAADAAPSSLARVLDVFALYGQVPRQFLSRRHDQSDAELVIDAQLDSLDASVAAAVARRLLRVVGVSSVLYSEKHGCAA
jgi:hypothetical protein